MNLPSRASNFWATLIDCKLRRRQEKQVIWLLTLEIWPNYKSSDERGHGCKKRLGTLLMW